MRTKLILITVLVLYSCFGILSKVQITQLFSGDTVTIWDVDIKECCPSNYTYSRVMFDTNNIFLTDNNYQRSRPDWSGWTIANWVTLKVYSVLGQEVATLVNEKKEAGKYQVEFNASPLPTGVYYYRLAAGNYVSTKKLILIR